MEELIDKIVKEYPDFAKKWIEVRLKNEINTNKKLPDENTIMKIRDCLASLEETSKTIKKLDRISFKDMNTIQEKWHKELASKSEKLKEFGGNPFEYEPVLKCDNGFQWVRLDTPESKDFEGNAMGHCVGQGGYDDNKTTIFSLRDKNNFPHVTVEFDKERNIIKQIQGKGNTEPNEKYYGDIVKLYEKTGATNYDKLIGNKTSAVLNDKVLIGDNAILACQNNTVFDSVKIGSDSNIKEWNYSVKDYFDASNSKLESVSPECKFGGKVDISGCENIKEWHHNVPGYFNAYGSKLEYVNPECVFGGKVNINRTNIKEWNFDVPGDFYAYGSKLEYVNPDCVFGGEVDVSNTNIKVWNINVSGDFNAYDSKLEYVNPECVFGGKVNIGLTNIKEWHCDVSDFFASNSKLEYVNPECKFGGPVNIDRTNITEWHHDIPGNFSAENSKLEYVNPDCVFGGKVDVSNTNIKVWNINVSGDFNARFSALEYVNPDCNFGGYVDVCNTNIKEWHCDVPRNFYALYSKLEYVNPDCIFGGDVNICDTKNIKEWNCDVGGDFYVKNSKLERIVNCEIKGKIHRNDKIEIINEEKQTMRM